MDWRAVGAAVANCRARAAPLRRAHRPGAAAEKRANGALGPGRLRAPALPTPLPPARLGAPPGCLWGRDFKGFMFLDAGQNMELNRVRAPGGPPDRRDVPTCLADPRTPEPNIFEVFLMC